ncbi:MAG: response regulator, partial [Aggregatilineales bacterium]
MDRTEQSIMVVDDTPANLRLLMEMLTAQGYRVRSAPNGARALASIAKSAPDLILLDIMMPGMDGYQVCEELKKDDGLRDIPVIFISALDEVFDKVKAFEVGGVDYITKPFHVDEVLARVYTHLQMREMQRTLQEQNLELEAFAHTVAHDLKNPLSTVIASLDWIQTRPGAKPLDESADKLFNLGLNSAHKMRSIIDELLLLASVRKDSVRYYPVNMERVVDQALGRIAHMVQNYEPEFIFPDTYPEIVSYAPWIEEIWV